MGVGMSLEKWRPRGGPGAEKGVLVVWGPVAGWAGVRRAQGPPGFRLLLSTMVGSRKAEPLGADHVDKQPRLSSTVQGMCAPYPGWVTCCVLSAYRPHFFLVTSPPPPEGIADPQVRCLAQHTVPAGRSQFQSVVLSPAGAVSAHLTCLGESAWVCWDDTEEVRSQASDSTPGLRERYLTPLKVGFPPYTGTVMHSL